MKFNVEVPIAVPDLAKLFSELNDDEQAQFFCLAAALIGDTHARSIQAYYIGNHLRTCECSTDVGRDFVREIVESMDSPKL